MSITWWGRRSSPHPRQGRHGYQSESTPERDSRCSPVTVRAPLSNAQGRSPQWQRNSITASVHRQVQPRREYACGNIPAALTTLRSNPKDSTINYQHSSSWLRVYSSRMFGASSGIAREGLLRASGALSPRGDSRRATVLVPRGTLGRPGVLAGGDVGPLYDHHGDQTKPKGSPELGSPEGGVTGICCDSGGFTVDSFAYFTLPGFSPGALCPVGPPA